MTKQELLKKIKEYIPFNEQEENDKKLITEWIENNDDAFSRSNNTAHMTASAWIVNETKTKVLMAYHNIYNSWSWLGGHADGECNLLEVAGREVMEESGITNALPLSDNIYSLEILTVNGHIKKGIYVPSHLHMNITYLFEANEKERLSVKEDENSGVKWFNLDEAIKASDEKWIRENIYKKLNNKLIFLQDIRKTDN